MDPKDSNSFSVLKECACNIDRKIVQIERALLSPSLFGDPLKAAASEECVNQLIEEVVDIKDYVNKLAEETRHNLEVLKKSTDELSATKTSLVRQLVETESHLQKYGYKHLQMESSDLLSDKEEEMCDDKNKVTDDISTPREELVTKDFEDLDLSYKECLTPFLTVAQPKSNTLAASNQDYTPRILVESEAMQSSTVSDLTIPTHNDVESPEFSESYYMLERKFKMHKQQQKAHD